MTRITLPSGITSIPNYAFNECTSLTKIIIPDKVTSIGTRAFSWCSTLRRVEIPASVTSIGENAFISCSSLEYVIVPDTTKDFGKSIFKDCPKPTVVTSESSPCADTANRKRIIPGYYSQTAGGNLRAPHRALQARDKEEVRNEGRVSAYAQSKQQLRITRKTTPE
jgi:hypothetical protein